MIACLITVDINATIFKKLVHLL